VLPGGTLQTCFQIHSPDVVTVTELWADADRPRADALVTSRPGIVLGVLTADCAPVLFCDGQAGVVGAAHAGWKGAYTGVTDATIAAMEALGASRERIAAVVGPCIAQKSYEVDAGFEARFLEQAPENERFFRAGREGHAWFDLEGYVASRLRDAGLAKVGMLGEDTYAQEERFYSFRRATHRKEPGYGRQISLIGLRS
ncbi:MAG: peptidoglycan editing factor PgeF, partial [Novosphingobium sp.]